MKENYFNSKNLDMTPEEKNVEKAAKKMYHYAETINAFIKGAKSDVANALHKKGLFTKEEVKGLALLATSEGVTRGVNALDYFERWFELNT